MKTTIKEPNLGNFQIVRPIEIHPGKSIPNQYKIITDRGIIFQSYQSIIYFYDNKTGKEYIGSEWNKSKTTSKYLRNFISRREIECNESEVILVKAW